MSLVVEHIHKSFGEVQAIKDLSMEVEEGALFGFLGPNGAGKMTTMRMILMVKHQDKVASAVQIPGILVVSGFALVYLEAFSPNTIWTKVLSYVPFYTSELMLVRIGLGAVVWWEIVATIALMLVAISACAWFSARAYRLGVLMYGQRPSLRQLRKMVRTN